MNEYELLFIVSPRVAADDVSGAIERVSSLVASSGGEVLSLDNWGRRRLAYPIKHYFEGTYVVMTLRLPPAATATLEASLIVSEEVIRHLLTEGIIPPTARDRRGPDHGEDRERRPEAAEAPPAQAEEAPETDASEAEAPVAVEEVSDSAGEAEPAPAAAE